MAAVEPGSPSGSLSKDESIVDNGLNDCDGETHKDVGGGQQKTVPLRDRRTSQDRRSLRRSRSPERGPRREPSEEGAVLKQPSSIQEKATDKVSVGECTPDSNKIGHFSPSSPTSPAKHVHYRRRTDSWRPSRYRYGDHYSHLRQPAVAPEVPPPMDYDSEVPNKWVTEFDPNTNWHYYRNLRTGKTQWENPEPQHPAKIDTEAVHPAVKAGYNPKIHGSWDPNADYAKATDDDFTATEQQAQVPGATSATADYTSTGTFNRFTGKYTNTLVNPTHTPDAHTDTAKANRQMNAYFDANAAANLHGGKSLKDARRNQILSKQEVKQLAEKKKAKKAKRQMDWLKSDK